MSREDLTDFEEFPDDEVGDFEDSDNEVIKKSSRDNKRESKRRRLDDLLEAKQLRADLGQFEDEAWSNDAYYDDILKDGDSEE